jgi:hypothetical protein
MNFWFKLGKYWYGIYRWRLYRFPVIQGSGPANTTQNRFAFGDDDGSESGHSLDTENADRTAQNPDVTFLLRIQVEENNSKDDAWDFILRAEKNQTGGYTDVTATRTDGVRLANDTQSRADNEATTERLTAGSGTWKAGYYDDGTTEDGMGSTLTLNGQYSDLEFAIELSTADGNLANDDDFDFRVYDQVGTALDGYTVTPRVTAANVPTVVNLNTANITANGQQIKPLAPKGWIIGAGDLDFEEGDKTDFDSQTNGSNLAVNGSAALVGSYGVEVTLSTTDTYGAESEVVGTDKLRCRFYFDPNSCTLAANSDNRIVYLDTDGTWLSAALVYIDYRDVSGSKEIWGVANDDAGSGSVTSSAVISDVAHYIEFLLERETYDGGNDGTFEVWLDGVSIGGKVTDLDNWNLFRTFDEVRMGVMSGDAGISGSWYLDDLLLRDDDTLIGPAVSGVTIPLDTAAATCNGQTLGLSPGAVTKVLDTAAAQANGQAITLVKGAVTIPLDTALATAAGQVIAITSDILRVLDTANITAQGQVITLALGAVTVPLNTAQAQANGQVITISLVTTIPLDTAQAQANGQAIGLVMGAVSTGLNTAALTAQGQVITVTLATIIPLLTAQAQANGQAISLSLGAVSVPINTAGLTAQGQAVALVMGVATTALDTAALTAGGQAVALVMGAATVGLNTAGLTAQGQVIVIDLGGPITVIFATAAMTASVPQFAIIIVGEVQAGVRFDAVRGRRTNRYKPYRVSTHRPYRRKGRKR